MTALVDRAKELDDDLPDNTCPGCLADITGWEACMAHFTGSVDQTTETTRRERKRGGVRPPWPFTGAIVSHGPPLCPWTRDYLAARRFRRALIAGGDQ